jgi:hypothetical protein
VHMEVDRRRGHRPMVASWSVCAYLAER